MASINDIRLRALIQNPLILVLGDKPSLKTTLISRNIIVAGRRTSIRLEPDMWDGLREFAIANIQACIKYVLRYLYRSPKNHR